MKHLSTKEFRETMMRQFKNKDVPVMGTFEITGRCNFDCKMCYVHTKTNAEFIKTERSGDWWISVIEEACERGMLFALITGGECLLHPDFQRIYRYLRSKGVYTSINTNGYFLTEEVVSFLKQDPPFEIQITLYGTNDESYYKVTGCYAFSQVQEGIVRAKEAGLNLKVAVTPNPYAPEETAEIVKYLKGLSVQTVITEALHTSHEDKGGQTLLDKQVKLEEKIRYLSIAKEEKLRTVAIEDLPTVGGGKEVPIVGMKCSGGSASFFITQDGKMQPCATMHNIRIPIDAANEFEKAWKKLREEAKKFLQPIECEGCAYKKVCLPCPLLRNGKVGNGHCDPEICEATRKLVAAGVKKLEVPKETPCDE